MPFNERITEYGIALLKNDLVPWNQVIRLVTETGHRVFIAFNPQPNWLEITGTHTNAFLSPSEFDRTFHLLQSEAPVYFTALNVVGISAFLITTDLMMATEAPGEGPADEDAQVQMALMQPFVVASEDLEGSE